MPEENTPRGVFFEYIAFYLTAAFGEEAYAVHYYARRLGHELMKRRELLPNVADHPRAEERYDQLQLGPVQKREPPIFSLRWRRITFIHTTWDRFQAAEEINDLFVEGGEFVDRLYHALRDSGLSPERHYPVREAKAEYVAILAVPCHESEQLPNAPAQRMTNNRLVSEKLSRIIPGHEVGRVRFVGGWLIPRGGANNRTAEGYIV